MCDGWPSSKLGFNYHRRSLEVAPKRRPAPPSLVPKRPSTAQACWRRLKPTVCCPNPLRRPHRPSRSLIAAHTLVHLRARCTLTGRSRSATMNECVACALKSRPSCWIVRAAAAAVVGLTTRTTTVEKRRQRKDRVTPISHQAARRRCGRRQMMMMLITVKRHQQQSANSTPADPYRHHPISVSLLSGISAAPTLPSRTTINGLMPTRGMTPESVTTTTANQHVTWIRTAPLRLYQSERHLVSVRLSHMIAMT